MIDLFYAGGPLFMSLLTLILAAVVWVKFRFPTHIKTLGSLAIAFGFFGFMLGLFQLFEAVESQQLNISPALLAGGLKNAIISPLYGTLIFIICRVLQLNSLD